MSGKPVDHGTLLGRLCDAGLVAIARGGHSPDELLALAGALCRGGVTAVEITLNSAHALEGIRLLQRGLGDTVLLGAGTVRSRDDVDRALEAGAQFLVAPALSEAVLARANEHGALLLPGVLTPSEIERAVAGGCRMVKLFPAGAMGPAYLRAVRAPLDDVAFMPTGGVGAEDLAGFVAAGAAAFGIGSALVRDLPVDEAELARVELAARELMARLAAARAAASG